jgi:hypothetical protein
MSSGKTFTFYERQEDRKHIMNIADAALNCNGTIFGGYVRDYLRYKYFEEQFLKRHKWVDYWNIDVDPETVDRTLLAHDLDVVFKTEQDAANFIKILKTNCGPCYTVAEMSSKQNDYFETKHKKYSIQYHVSLGPITYVFDFEADVIVCANAHFTKIDAITNCLGMAGPNIFVLPATRTFLDRLSMYERIGAVQRIMNLIIRKETYVIDRKIPAYRVAKLLKNGYKILNQDFYTELRELEICHICQDDKTKSDVQIKDSHDKLCIECFAKLINVPRTMPSGMPSNIKEGHFKTTVREEKKIKFRKIVTFAQIIPGDEYIADDLESDTESIPEKTAIKTGGPPVSDSEDDYYEEDEDDGDM